MVLVILRGKKKNGIGSFRGETPVPRIRDSEFSRKLRCYQRAEFSGSFMDVFMDGFMDVFMDVFMDGFMDVFMDGFPEPVDQR